mmetsp:Transcript_11985/g.21535  ORF Transcript_11985/g.21535 Transcript_11985/m.21535 type:complete len:240 (+) Transcript_11985:101-820(+)
MCVQLLVIRPCKIETKAHVAEEVDKKNPSRTNSYSTGASKHFGGPSSNVTKHVENNHPNFEDSISKLPWQPPSSNRSPLREQKSGLNEGSITYMPNSYLKRSGALAPDARQDFRSKRNVEVLHEEILSTCSSLSTVPGMPTPCQLNLDVSSDDDTLYTVDNCLTPVGLYPEATAPPLSPSNPGYGSRKTMSSSSGYLDSHSDKVTEDDDDHRGPNAKWGVHHILDWQRSVSASEQKKSR